MSDDEQQIIRVAHFERTRRRLNEILRRITEIDVEKHQLMNEIDGIKKNFTSKRCISTRRLTG